MSSSAKKVDIFGSFLDAPSAPPKHSNAADEAAPDRGGDVETELLRILAGESEPADLGRLASATRAKPTLLIETLVDLEKAKLVDRVGSASFRLTSMGRNLVGSGQ